jgi:Flp pilus assembly protein TadG
MVEFALLLPVLMFVLILGIDFARVFYYDQTIVNCARNGAIYESDPSSALRATYADYKKAALADAGDLSPALTEADITSASSGSDVSVTVNYQFPTITTYLGFSTVNLSKTVTMRVAQAVPD